MNLQNARDQWRRFFDRFDPDKLRRAKMIGACVFVAIAVLWFAFRVVPMFTPPKRAQELTGPGWELARELNDALSEKPAFVDTAFRLESEDPLKLRLVGAVRSKRDLEALKAFIRSLKPDAPPDQFEFAVEILE